MSPSFVAGEGGGSNVAYKVNCRRHTGRKNNVEAGQDRLSCLFVFSSSAVPTSKYKSK